MSGEEDVGRRLAGERPVPAPAYRGALGRHLGARRPPSRPANLCRRVLALAVPGLILLALALAGLAGAGPLDL